MEIILLTSMIRCVWFVKGGSDFWKTNFVISSFTLISGRTFGLCVGDVNFYLCWDPNIGGSTEAASSGQS